MDAQQRFRGCLLGLACGDAVGAAVGFLPRGSFPRLTDMIGGGRFELAPGQWTDDTSMALCLATSLVAENGFNPRDQMQRYSHWLKDGAFSSTGRSFGVGPTVALSLERFERTGDPFSGPTDPVPAANGCIARLAPVPMFFHADWRQAVARSGESARTTHGARECVDACMLLGAMLYKALNGLSKDEILLGPHFHSDSDVDLSESLLSIARGDYRDLAEASIRGSGYVVKSLEAALWCFYRNGSYEDAVLDAANLGEDADTTAAVCGQLAGAHWGTDGIPRAWRERVAMGAVIEGLARSLYEAGLRNR